MARRRREGLPLNSEINVVSLIDVMLLLLVIFMITAPMLQGGVEVSVRFPSETARDARERIREERRDLRRQRKLNRGQ